MEQYLSTAVNWLSTTGLELLINIIGALVIFFIGMWVVKLIRRVLVRLMRRHKVDDTLISFATNIAYVLLMAFVIIAALGQLGVQTATFVAIIAAAGLAIGLALQGSLANFAAGVMIIMFRYFRKGDYVEAGGTSGTVEDIHIFHTQLMTADNRVIVVPNGSITSGVIVNYSLMDTRRVDMVIGVHYDTDLARARALLEEILAGDERVLKEPEAVVVVGELGASTVDFLVRPWCKADDYWSLKWDMLQTIKTRFEQEGIAIAFPQMDVHLFKEKDATQEVKEAAPA